jgi:hypothetical protein
MVESDQDRAALGSQLAAVLARQAELEGEADLNRQTLSPAAAAQRAALARAEEIDESLQSAAALEQKLRGRLFATAPEPLRRLVQLIDRTVAEVLDGTILTHPREHVRQEVHEHNRRVESLGARLDALRTGREAALVLAHEYHEPAALNAKLLKLARQLGLPWSAEPPKAPQPLGAEEGDWTP